MEKYTAKIGYKGFDKDLKTTNLGGATPEQFEVGKVYYKDNKENPVLCTKDGYHYCTDLNCVFTHYPNNGNNRFCEIEILGNFTETKEKCITTAFRIKREISKEDILKLKEEQDKKKLISKLNLDEVRFLQKQNPFCHVGGSISLFLRGLNLKRWNNGNIDIDLISPFFYNWISDDENEIEHKDAKKSGSDFDQTFILNNTKVDVKIDNTQPYEIIKYDGFDYKVSRLEVVMQAKLKYAINGQEKHKKDVYELLGLKL